MLTLSGIFSSHVDSMTHALMFCWFCKVYLAAIWPPYKTLITLFLLMSVGQKLNQKTGSAIQAKKVWLTRIQIKLSICNRWFARLIENLVTGEIGWLWASSEITPMHEICEIAVWFLIQDYSQCEHSSSEIRAWMLTWLWNSSLAVLTIWKSYSNSLPKGIFPDHITLLASGKLQKLI